MKHPHAQTRVPPHHDSRHGRGNSQIAAHKPSEHKPGTDRRRHLRWRVPKDLFPAALAGRRGNIPVTITDVSDKGIGISFTQQLRLAAGDPVRLVLTEHGIELEAVVRSFRAQGAGLQVTGNTEALEVMVGTVRAARGVAVHGANGAVRVEGFVGFQARVDLKLSRPLTRIDLSRATGIDSFGLGILLSHLEKGCHVAGCNGDVAHLAEVAGICQRFCAQRKAGTPEMVLCEARRANRPKRGD